MITISQLYEWAKENALENRELITVHSFEFDEDPGEINYVKINGEKQYIEFVKEEKADERV